jgi:hypothetical protein
MSDGIPALQAFESRPGDSTDGSSLGLDAFGLSLGRRLDSNHPELAKPVDAGLAANGHISLVAGFESRLPVPEVDIAPTVLAGGPVRVRRVPGLPEQDSHPAPMVVLSVKLGVNIFG